MKKPDTLSITKEYRKHGFSVIPLLPKSKKPAIPWREFQKRLPTDEELEREFGELLHTVEVLTWSGGRHIFFRYPESGVGCKTGVRPGIDVRGDNGYVIAAPSVIEGRSYEWEVSHHPDETTIADAPEWLLKLLDGPFISAASKTNGNVIPSGQRNSTLTRLAGALRRSAVNAGAAAYVVFGLAVHLRAPCCLIVFFKIAMPSEGIGWQRRKKEHDEKTTHHASCWRSLFFLSLMSSLSRSTGVFIRYFMAEFSSVR